MTIGKYVIIGISYFVFYIVTGTIIMIFDKKRFINDKESFYYGYFGIRKIFKKKSLVEKICEVLTRGCIALPIFVVGVCAGWINGLREYWNGTGAYVDELVGIMFNMWIALMGVLIVFISFIKKTWLTFTADDIVKRFKIKEDVVKMGIYILICGIIQFFKPIMLSAQLNLEYQWYFGVRFLELFIFIVFTWSFIKMSYLLIESFFGDKIEKIFLDSLYEELWCNPVRRMERKDNWKDDIIVKEYTNYLIDNYLLFSRKIKLEEIHKIGFTTNLYAEGSDEYKSERYKIIKKRSIHYMLGIAAFNLVLLIALVGIEVLKTTMTVGEWIATAILSAIIMLVIVYIFRCFIKPFVMFAIVFTNGRCSYELVYKEDSGQKIRRRFVREVAILTRSNYYQYVHAMENIIAFYWIAPEDVKSIIYEELSKKCLYKIGESEMCLPLVVIDYLINISEQEKKLLPYVDIKEDDLIKRLARAFCLDIGRRCCNCAEEDGIAKFDIYIKIRKEENVVYLGKTTKQ